MQHFKSHLSDAAWRLEEDVDHIDGNEADRRHSQDGADAVRPCRVGIRQVRDGLELDHVEDKHALKHDKLASRAATA